MPSCDTCDRNWTPTSLRPDGTCPTCGAKLELRRSLGPPAGAAAGGGHRASQADPKADPNTDLNADREASTEAGTEPGTEPGTEVRPGAPWHFKVLLVALIVYLGWRGVQGIDWIARHL